MCKTRNIAIHSNALLFWSEIEQATQTNDVVKFYWHDLFIWITSKYKKAIAEHDTFFMINILKYYYICLYINIIENDILLSTLALDITNCIIFCHFKNVKKVIFSLNWIVYKRYRKTLTQKLLKSIPRIVLIIVRIMKKYRQSCHLVPTKSFSFFSCS